MLQLVQGFHNDVCGCGLTAHARQLLLVQHVVLHELDTNPGTLASPFNTSSLYCAYQDSISHDMSVRTGSLPTSRKRVISRAVVLVVCSAAVLLLCWSILKPGADTSLQDPATELQQTRVVRFRLEVAFPSCLTGYMQCSPSAFLALCRASRGP